jgi:hypothetical protein
MGLETAWGVTRESGGALAANLVKPRRPALTRVVPAAILVDAGAAEARFAQGAERPGTRHVRRLALRVCDRRFEVVCPDLETAALLQLAFGGLEIPARHATRHIDAACHVDRDEQAAYRVRGEAGSVTWCEDADDLLYHVDKFLTLAVQRQRPDLYFLHAAAVAWNGTVAVLSAPPGTGKSTLAAGLLQNGFAYLSDELAPIDVNKLVVHPFAHALCLKEPVPDGLRLPADAVRIGKRFHVASGLFATPPLTQALPLGAFIFVARSGGPRTSERIGAAAGAARLLSNTLNGRCHAGDGLPAAVRLAQRVPCFTLDVTDLVAACGEVRAILGQTGGTAF